MLQDVPYSTRVWGLPRNIITKLSVGLHTSIKCQNAGRDTYGPLTVEFTGNKPKVLMEGGGHLFKANNYLLFSLFKKRRIVMPARNEKKKKQNPRFL